MVLFCDDRAGVGFLPAELFSSMSVSLNCIQKSSVIETNAGLLLLMTVKSSSQSGTTSAIYNHN